MMSLNDVTRQKYFLGRLKRLCSGVIWLSHCSSAFMVVQLCGPIKEETETGTAPLPNLELFPF